MSIIEVLLIFFAKQFIFSMWVLILTLQFFVFIAVWQINYPRRIKLLITEFRRMALGEFMDDLDIGSEIANAFNLSSSAESAADEKVGEERLSSGRSVIGSFGITQLLILISLCTLILLLMIAIKMKSKIELSEKVKKLIERVKSYIFFNPIIRYLLLNSIKLNFMALIIFRPPIGNSLNIALATIVVMVNIGVPIFFYMLLRRNNESLIEEQKLKTFGALYAG